MLILEIVVALAIFALFGPLIVALLGAGIVLAIGAGVLAVVWFTMGAWGFLVAAVLFAAWYAFEKHAERERELEAVKQREQQLERKKVEQQQAAERYARTQARYRERMKADGINPDTWSWM